MKIKQLLLKAEPAEGDAPAESYATAIVKVACILVIGICILNATVDASNITSGSTFYSLYTAVKANITSGVTLAGLMVLALGAAGIMHFLGFM